MSYSNVKSVVIDIADNWDATEWGMAVRSIEFLNTDSDVISLTASDFTAYATTYNYLDDNSHPRNAFDTTLSKTGIDLNNEWYSDCDNYSGANQITDQRLICVFNNTQSINGIVVNNHHWYGDTLGIGIKNVKIYFSTDTITDTTYNASISNSTLVFDGQIAQHVSSDVVDDQVLTLIVIDPESEGSISESLDVTDSVEYDYIEWNRTIDDESLGIADDVSVVVNYQLITNESLVIVDSSQNSISLNGLLIDDSLSLTETITPFRIYLLGVADSLGVSETITAKEIYDVITILDGLGLYDNVKSSLILQLADGLVVVDSATANRLITLIESLQAVDAATPQYSGNATINDNVMVIDTPILLKVLLGSIEESLSVVDAANPQLLLLIQEYLNIRDVIIGSKSISASLSDSVNAVDSAIAKWLLSITESLISTDTATPQFSIFVSDFANIVESLNALSIRNVAVADSLVAVDNVIISWLLNLSESLGVDDAFIATIYGEIAEYINVRDSLNVIAQYSLGVDDAILITDEAIAKWLISLVETVGIEDAALAVNAIYEAVSESLTLAETLEILGVWNRNVSETITMSDTASLMFYLLESVEDSLGVADTVSVVSIIAEILSESLSVADDVIGSRKFALVALESLDIVDDVASNSRYGLTVQEMLSVNLTMILDGEVYECFVLNTSKFHPSAYSNFSFNSYCVFRNRAFAANSLGIFEITGDTDNGSDIHTGLILHDTDFGLPSKKKFRKAYLTIDGDNPLLVMESDGVRKAYTIDNKGMADASRTVKGREWTISVSDFEVLESMKLIPVILARGN